MKILRIAAVVAAAAIGCTAFLAAAGTTISSSATLAAPNRDTCAGYPQPRVFLEAQSWWTVMPGHTMAEPFQDRTGHVHLGGCIPVYQTLTGPTHLDLRWQLHMMQGVQLTDVSVTVEGETKTWSGLLKDGIGGFTSTSCPTMQCDGWISYDLPVDQVPFSGWVRLNLIARGFFADGRLSTTRTSYPINLQNGKPDDSTVTASAPVIGGGWFTKPPENSLKYTLVTIAKAELSKLYNLDTGQQVAKSGKFDITVSLGGPAQRVMVDAALHAIPPTIKATLLDVPPAGNTGSDAQPIISTRTVTVDTTILSNGVHRLVFEARRHRSDGQHSGLLALPFLVDNPLPPDPAGYHPACEPTCDEQIAQLNADMDAHMRELDRLKDIIARATDVLKEAP